MGQPEVISCSWPVESEAMIAARRASEALRQLGVDGLSASTQMAALGALMRLAANAPREMRQ